MISGNCLLSPGSLGNIPTTVSGIYSPSRKAKAIFTKSNNLEIYVAGIKIYDLAKALQKESVLSIGGSGDGYLHLSNTSLIWGKYPMNTGRIYTKIDFSNTDPNERKKLCLTDNGNLIIYATSSGSPIWSLKPLETTSSKSLFLYLAIGAAIFFGFIKKANKK